MRPHKVSNIIISTLLMRKLRLKESKCLVQGHPAWWWRSQDLGQPGCSLTHCTPLTHMEESSCLMNWIWSHQPCLEDEPKYVSLPFVGDGPFPLLKRLCPKDCPNQHLLGLPVIAKKKKKDCQRSKRKCHIVTILLHSLLTQAFLGLLDTQVTSQIISLSSLKDSE